MGYITNNPALWLAKRSPTAEELDQIGRLSDRSGRWQDAADRLLRVACRVLGYDVEQLQGSKEWLECYKKCLLDNDQWSERRSIATMLEFHPRRTGLALLALYLFAQHGRVQYIYRSEGSSNREDGSPWEELSRNGHNLDHQLMNVICFLTVFQYSPMGAPKTDSWVARRVSSQVSSWLGPLKNLPITRGTVTRWTRVAEMAGGIAAPRDVKTLDKTCVKTATSAWKPLYHRSMRHFQAAWQDMWPQATWLVVLLCAWDGYGVYRLLHWVHGLLHL